MFLRPGLALSMCATFGLAAVGCSGSSDPNRELSGRVDTQAYALDNASVVAHTADGRRFLAAIQRDGSFSLRLPVGVRYSLAIANRTRQGGLREISLLTWHGTKGRTHAVAVAAGGAIDLGFIHPVGATVRNASTPSPIGPASSSDDSPGGQGDHGDCEDHEHTDVCVDQQHDESECDNDDHDGLDCDAEDTGGGKAADGGNLATASEGSHGDHDSDDDDHDHGDDDATTCSTPADPTTPGTTTPGTTTPGTTPTPGSSGGGNGSTCLVSADCAAPLTCIASQCAPVVF